MTIAEHAPNRPALFTGPTSLDPAPRLFQPSAPAAPITPPASAAQMPAPTADQSVVSVPRAPAPEASAPAPAWDRAPKVLAPGQVVLPAEARLSLPRLFKLEEELCRLLGQREVQIDIDEDGRVVITVTPEQASRVQDYLMLATDLSAEGPARA